MWSAVVVYEKVRCQCRNKEPTVKVQQVEQVRIVSEFVLGFFAVCATRVKDTWVSTQRIRLCFCVGFFYWEMFLLLFPCENKVLRVQSGCHLGISATLSFCCLVAEGFYLS